MCVVGIIYGVFVPEVRGITWTPRNKPERLRARLKECEVSRAIISGVSLLYGTLQELLYQHAPVCLKWRALRHCLVSSEFFTHLPTHTHPHTYTHTHTHTHTHSHTHTHAVKDSAEKRSVGNSDSRKTLWGHRETDH